MMGKQDRWRWMILAVLFSALLLVMTASPTNAAVQHWAVWKMTVSFPNNNMDTTLIIQIGHTTSNNKNIIDKEEDFPVTCVAVGSPVIQNNQATFDGSSYFSCAVPNIQDKVFLMSNGLLFIPDTCGSKRPFISTVASINGSPGQASPTNPLFYRMNSDQIGDFSLSAPLNVATQQAVLESQFGQVTAASSTFAILGDQVIKAKYEKTGSNTFTPIFTVDANSLSSTPAVVNGPIILSTLESTAYIGYSPATGNYFEGTLTSMLVDPYCSGTG